MTPNDTTFKNKVLGLILMRIILIFNNVLFVGVSWTINF